MEAVAPHAARGDLGGQRESLRHLGLRTMEGGVEAGHLRQVRTQLRNDVDGLEVVRLVQRRERVQLLERRDHLRGDQHGLRELHAAVHDPVADRHELVVATALAQELDQVIDRAGVAELDALAPVLRADLGALGVLGDEPRRSVEALDLSAHAAAGARRFPHRTH